MKKSDITAKLTKHEIYGMLAILIAGLILVIGNLLFDWHFQTWRYEFWGLPSSYNSHSFSNLIFNLIWLHLPAFAGAWMVISAIRFFRKNKN